MTFISRGEVYDGYPMGADCDWDALIARRYENFRQRYVPGLISDAFTAAFSVAAGLLPVLPAAAGLGGAGSPVPVSGPAPGTPNETRNE
ncbi:hypothetical protein CH274_13505 [Rhodococcus sp. 06-418-5]|uniref:hypothetical protein n=1 Tax=Rhodococcus sp. 06-418-5 TaxID=2022507 RepID=UPI000B9A7BB8|nr:hypothetical protein [Rhodococcus sp. 06-418-5]OZC80246.1 hypothetical protein CH274_13505 [Rhodococcus sp. 06-418-5]